MRDEGCIQSVKQALGRPQPAGTCFSEETAAATGAWIQVTEAVVKGSMMRAELGVGEQRPRT